MKTDHESASLKNADSNESLLAKYRILSTLSQISSLLSFSDNLDEKINESLSLLGRLCNADHIFIFKLQPEGKFADKTHEWFGGGIKSQKDMFRNFEVANYSFWTKSLYRDKIFNINDLDELPSQYDAEKELFKKQGTKSLLLIPFFVERKISGFVGFASIGEKRDWSGKEIEILRTFGNILGMALEEKTVIEKLSIERKQLLSVFDSIEEPVYVSDPYTHEILYVNNRLRKLIDKEAVGKKCYEILQKNNKPCDFCTNPIILKSKNKTHIWEYHNPVSERDFIISDRIIKWPDGRDVRLEIAHDITEIKETERALKEKEDIFKKLIDSSPLPIAIIDLEWNFQYINNRLTEMLGYTIEDVPILEKWLERLYPDEKDRDRAKKGWENLSKEKETGFCGEWTLTCKDGTKKQIAFYFTRTSNGIIIVLNDLTELKRTEEALMLDESCLETLHELSQMNIFSVDEIKSFALNEGVKLTKSATGILAFFDEKDQALCTGTCPEDLFTMNNINEDLFLSMFENTSIWPKFNAGKKTVIINGPLDEIASKDAVLFKKLSIRSLLVVPIFNENEVVGFAAVANKEDNYTISDARQLALIAQMMAGMILLKQSEDELTRSNRKLTDINTELSMANDELQSLDELKNNFLSTMSHELKTPLISILGFSELVGDEVLGPLNKEQKKAMNVVNTNSTHLKRLIESLLFMSSLGAKNYIYDFNSVAIKSVIDKSLSIISIENNDKKITVENRLPENLPLIMGDSDYLTELFIHLIDNAFKFTQSEGKLSLYGTVEHDKVHIIIEDTGIGIPETKIMKTFDSFYQLDSSLARKYGGAGIGLNICKRITEDHGGKLWIESTEGVGTKVHVTLPLKGNIISANLSVSS